MDRFESHTIPLRLYAEYSRTARISTCDKCGEAVHPSNSALYISFYAGYLDSMTFLTAQDRHLFPVERDGKNICPGSPSRAQYIEGHPRDPRSEYTYDPEIEEVMRSALERVRREFPETS